MSAKVGQFTVATGTLKRGSLSGPNRDASDSYQARGQDDLERRFGRRDCDTAVVHLPVVICTQREDVRRGQRASHTA